MHRSTSAKLATMRWLRVCLLLVVAVGGHDLLMASSGQHVAVAVVESTCEPPVPAAHHGQRAHRRRTPNVAADHEPSELPIDCEPVRVVAPIKRTLDDVPDSPTISAPPLPPAPILLLESQPRASDWLARDPAARRALWQVYRI